MRLPAFQCLLHLALQFFPPDGQQVNCLTGLGDVQSVDRDAKFLFLSRVVVKCGNVPFHLPYYAMSCKSWGEAETGVVMTGI